MLRCRNLWAVGDQHKLFEIFEVNLKHDDTYLYLAAVDGLMSLVDVHHETVVPLLCRRFIQMKTDGKRNFYDGMSGFHTPLRLIYNTRHLPLKAERVFCFPLFSSVAQKSVFSSPPRTNRNCFYFPATGKSHLKNSTPVGKSRIVKISL